MNPIVFLLCPFTYMYVSIKGMQSKDSRLVLGAGVTLDIVNPNN